MADNPLVPEKNPLTEADPRSLDQLLSASPESLSREEKLAIINALRAQRTKWKQEEMAGVKSKSKSAKTPKIAVNPNISLDDLGL